MCLVKGIDGSSITTIGMGSIKLCVAHSTYIILQNALYIPNATVCLISISTLAHDNQAVDHFNKNLCWITNKSTSAIIAHGTLLPNKNLYSWHFTPSTLSMPSPLNMHLTSKPCTTILAMQIIKPSKRWSAAV